MVRAQFEHTRWLRCRCSSPTRSGFLIHFAVASDGRPEGCDRVCSNCARAYRVANAGARIAHRAQARRSSIGLTTSRVTHNHPSCCGSGPTTCAARAIDAVTGSHFARASSRRASDSPPTRTRETPRHPPGYGGANGTPNSALPNRATQQLTFAWLACRLCSAREDTVRTARRTTAASAGTHAPTDWLLTE